jgi:hypothetical protein
MKVNLSVGLRCAGILWLFISGFLNLNAQLNDTYYKLPGEKDGRAVILSYNDTLSLPSSTEFDLPVKMKTGYGISAISLGFYYPPEYLQIDSVVLADHVQGFFSSDTNGLFMIAWSDINPINIADSGVLVTFSMRTLDLTALLGTIKLGIYESSEFADQSANIIEGVELEVPEIQYLVPDTTDIISTDSISVGPNPFYDYLSIDIYLKADSKVRISLCDLNGNEVYLATEMDYQKGLQETRLNSIDLSKGVYLMKIEIRNSEGSTTKLIKVMTLGKKH